MESRRYISQFLLNSIISVLMLVSPTQCFASGDDIDDDMIAESASAEERAHRQQSEKEGRGASTTYSNSREITAVTGFYAGGIVGMDFVSNRFHKDGKDDESKKVKKSKSGFTGGIFGGYNFQIGEILVGLECLIGMKPSKSETEVEVESEKKDASLKRSYNFGIAPRIGYAVWSGGFGYIRLGTDVVGYRFNLKNKSDSKETKKNKHKCIIQTAIGIEQHFGSWFVRAECGKCFNKKAGAIDGVNVSTRSWSGSVGAGYRF
ncbi:MAG: porin family protein [Holosporales bacterium]|nr:porin family protein [Holosporales bacterium]